MRLHDAKAAGSTRKPGIWARLKAEKQQCSEIPTLANAELGCDIEFFNRIIYKQSFTQKEVNGMLDFYKSEPGQAVIAKMPLVMQNTMQAMQARMNTTFPKLQKLQQDAIGQ